MASLFWWKMVRKYNSASSINKKIQRYHRYPNILNILKMKLVIPIIFNIILKKKNGDIFF